MITVWVERIREFIAKIDNVVTHTPEEMKTQDFMEIHWMTGEMFEIEEKMKQVLIARTSSSIQELNDDSN